MDINNFYKAQTLCRDISLHQEIIKDLTSCELGMSQISANALCSVLKDLYEMKIEGRDEAVEKIRLAMFEPIAANLKKLVKEFEAL